MDTLSSAKFVNDFVNTFPGDDSGDLRPRQTPGVLYSKAIPTPVASPKLLAWSYDLAREMHLEKPEQQSDVDILAGNFVSESMYPYAACYAGHQFGHWSGQLGDGRAITLGELPVTENKSLELQLKGAGQTPYSRRADGRAVLRSSVREYLMSEAMYYLGVPTTRALSMVLTGDQVLRDMFYDGHPEYEAGAIVARVAPSFLRFGSFEILAARKENENLQKLVDWTIAKFYPEFTGEDKIILFFQEVLERTAKLMVEWMRVGFVHGVMNTDNMSILGLTIDYGPYSFLDAYDPDFTPNTTDLPGKRYAFGKQANIAYWNLGALASALAPLFKDIQPLKDAMATYEDIFLKNFLEMMASKLGLDKLRAGDQDLILNLENILGTIQPDMTIFYQQLMDVDSEFQNTIDLLNFFEDSLYSEPEEEEAQKLMAIINAYVQRIEANECSREESRKKMKEANPRFILRNYLLHEAIEELETGNRTLFDKLQDAIKEPYSDKFDEFLVKRPDWASQKAGCSMLSCSS